jgi:hypothetical protein
MPDTPQTHSAAEPSHDDIARRAYALYCDGRYEDGHDLEHWLKAEEELRGKRQPHAIEKRDRRAARYRSTAADRSQAAGQAATDKAK